MSESSVFSKKPRPAQAGLNAMRPAWAGLGILRDIEDIDIASLFWLISEYLFLVKGMV